MSTIVLGVSGSIAGESRRPCGQADQGRTRCLPVLTPGGARFVAPATFSALTGRPCPVDIFDEPFPNEIAHIYLARAADLFVIAPASMDFIARIAAGLAQDMLSAAVLATSATVVLAPGMNTGMWENPATQANLRTLAGRGYQFVDPISGRLACNTVGIGKMEDVGAIFSAIERHLSGKSAWSGVRVLVTAGPTREYIDPVRFISNRSSGKMGYPIAEAAARQGARVTLVSGPVALSTPFGVELVAVDTASQMRDAVLGSGDYDAIFACAAVADYAPATYRRAKLRNLPTGCASI